LGRQKEILWIEDAHYLPAPAHFTSDAGAVNLALVPVGRPLIKVVGEYGRDVAGPDLALLPKRAMASTLSLIHTIKKLRQDVHGDQFGRVLLQAGRRTDYGCLYAKGYTLKTMDLGNGDDVRVETLHPANSYGVVVTDADTHRTIKFWHVVMAFALKGLPWMQFKEEANGEGKTRLAPAAYPCRLTFSAKGYAAQTLEVNSPPGERLSVQLEKGVIFAGQVVNQDGNPVTGAWVSQNAYDYSPTVYTDASGHFQMKPLPRSQAPFTLMYGADRYINGTTDNLPAKGDLNLRLVLDSGGSISGWVVDEDSHQPVQGAKLAIMASSGHSSQGGSFAVPVAENGRFTTSGLEPGNYEIHARAKGRQAPVVNVTIDEAQSEDVGEIDLSAHPMVKGTLVDPEGDSVSPGAKVHLERYLNFKDAPTALHTASIPCDLDEDGHFRAEGVAPGRYRLVASDGSYGKVVSPVDVSDDDVDLGTVTLEEQASIDGQLVAAGATTFAGWRLTLSSRAFDPDPSSTIASDDGSFNFGGIGAGTYEIQAFAPMSTAPKASQQVNLKAGQDAQVTIPIGGVSITAFLEIDGTPADGATVEVTPQTGNYFNQGVVQVMSDLGPVFMGMPAGRVSGTADPTGRVFLQGATPGPSQVSIEHGGMIYRMSVIIPSTPEAPLTWNFQGTILMGRVVDAGGGPVGGAVVSVGYAGVGTVPGDQVKADGAGHFKFTGLGDGTIVLTCRTDDGTSARTEVTIRDGASPGPVLLRLSGKN
jgi:hypothetical protein